VWIIPKNYEPSAFVPDTVESSEDLNLLENELNTSLLVRSKPMQLRSVLRKWKKDAWFRTLFGRILKPSQWKQFNRALLTSLQVDTHVNHFQQQASDLEVPTPDTSGPTSKTSLGQLSLFDASLKTSKDTLPKGCVTSCKTWQEWVTEQRGEYSARKRSELPIEEKESLSWPTGTVAGLVEGGVCKNVEVNEKGFQVVRQNGTKFGAKLRDTVIHYEAGTLNWPTPRANKIEGYSSENFSPTLHQVVGLHAQENHNTNGNRRESWPTPMARDWKGVGVKSESKRNSPNLPYQAKVWSAPEARNNKGYHNQKNGTRIYKLGSQVGKGKLNPDWVETLMGLTTGLTDLGCWGTE